MADNPFYPGKVADTSYHGSCHCGKTAFTVRLPSLSTITVGSCNCSICRINGALNVYPHRNDVVFQSGGNELKVYQFGNKYVAHKFCTDCGTSVLGDTAEWPPMEGLGDISDYLVVNARTFKDVDLDKLELKVFNGKEY